MIGRTIAHYRIVEKIGEGGMGVVYRAHDEHLEREVALKVLPPGSLVDESARKRFRKEALTLSKLNHPNIGTVYDFDSHADMDFLAMEYLPGVTLSDRLKRGPLPLNDVAELGAQIAQALVEAHEQGVVHRDLKPGNVMITPKGQAKVFDFGLARELPAEHVGATTEGLTDTNVGAGTLPYMAPEQLRGEKGDARSDIYAAGAVLYEMTTGRRLFPESQAPQLIEAILNRTPAPPSSSRRGIAPALETIILKAIDKNPNRRYQSAKELLVDLQRIGGTESPVPTPSRWPMAVALTAVVILTVALLLKWPPGGGSKDIESIAVLPMENLSGDASQDVFVNGMTEALIMNLAQIRALRVISWTSVMRYQGLKNKSLSEIAAELKVDAVVAGSVLRSADRVRINAELIRVPPERHLWAKSYDRDMHDVLALHSEVAQAIANEIRIQVTPQEHARLTSVRSVDPQAYEDYLQGRFLWVKRQPSDLERSIECFQRAIEKDPNYALAYAGMADAYALLGANGYDILPPREAMPKAMAAARKALEIDDTLAEAHASFGYVTLLYDWKWTVAERELKRSLELNPGYPTVHQWYAFYLSAMGRSVEALEELRKARTLDPHSLVILTSTMQVLYFARRHEEAIDLGRQVIEMDPNYVLGHHNLGQALVQKSRYPEAIAEYQRALTASGGSPAMLMSLGHAYAVAGDRAKAEDVLQQLEALSRKRYVPALYTSVVLMGLGRKADALHWLRKAFQERSDYFIFIKVEPMVDPLRSDPAFQDLVRGVGLQP